MLVRVRVLVRPPKLYNPIMRKIVDATVTEEELRQAEEELRNIANDPLMVITTSGCLQNDDWGARHNEDGA